MNCALSDIINPIKVVVLLTLLFAGFVLKSNVKMHRYLLIILWVCFLTELFSSIFKYFDVSLKVLYLASFAVHHTAWLLLLRENLESKSSITYGIWIFWVFSILNFTYIDYTGEFNFYNFIAGASIYLLFFIMESYRKLIDENVTFFISNNYILLFAPLLFFYGLGLMFGFKNSSIRAFIVYGEVSLYQFIINISDLASYILINIYIYRENKLRTHG